MSLDTWQRYDYHGAGYGYTGNIYHTYRPWKSLPASPASATTTNCHVTTYSYASPGYSYFQTEVSETQVKVLGVAVE